MSQSFLRCHASDCRRTFSVDPDATSALLEAARLRGGLKLTCPVCRLTYLYRAGELLVAPERTGVDRVRLVRSGTTLLLG